MAKATILIGPQGCGKSTLAREMAERNGTYLEIELQDLDLNKYATFPLSTAPNLKPRTVIVDGFPSQGNLLASVLRTVESGELIVRQKGKAPAAVNVERFIFTCDYTPVIPDGHKRLFNTIKVAADATNPPR